MYRGLRSAFLTISTGLLVTVGSATATTITTTSFQTWKTYLTGAPAEADFTAVQFSSYNTSAGISLAPVGDPGDAFTFTGPDNGGFQLSGTSFNSFTGLESSADSGAGINIAAPAAGKNAMLILADSTSGTPLTLTLSDGEIFTLANGVFGFSASHPITSLTLTTTPGSQVFMDDLWFGASSLTQDPVQGGGSDPSAAPEGATLIMMAGGGLILFGARRKAGAALPTA